MSVDEIGLWAGFVLTLMVFSYILGDNFLYRLAVYVFVGLAAGYIAIVTVESVLIPWFDTTIGSDDVGTYVIGMIPVLLGALLLLKTSSRLGRLGNLGIAVLIGVGTAVALVGALTGTLLPLAAATAAEGGGDLLNAVVIFVGVASSLIYFQYLARRRPDGEVRRRMAVQAISRVGQGFIVVTLGALYAAAILTSLTIFSDRMGFVLGRILGG
jgi:hypothetical protein